MHLNMSEGENINRNEEGSGTGFESLGSCLSPISNENVYYALIPRNNDLLSLG